MAKEIVSISISADVRKGIADMGYKISQFIEKAYYKWQKQEKLIEDLQLIAEKLQVEDVSKKRIQRLIRALNQIPAEEKHELINELVLNVIGIEKTDRELAETLQKINNSLKAVDKAKETKN